MARIPLDETPIYTQLAQEYAAREAFHRHFLEDPLPESYMNNLKALGKTYRVGGGTITVYGDPVGPRDD